MNVVKCSNGHFFDGDAYTQCPHCGASVGAPNSGTSEKSASKKGFSWFDRDKKKNSEPARAENAISLPSSGRSEASQEKVRDAGTFQPTASRETFSTRSDMSYDCGETVSLLDSNMASPAPATPAASVSEPAVSEPAPAPAEQPKVEDSGSSLKDMVKKASANAEGKTMSYFSAATAVKGADASTAASADERPADPVVGWLVCLHGKHFGESFVIGAGKNSIGRSDSNRIVLSKENSVSREKHALIVYEPKKRNFYLQPGDSSGLTYLNDDYITESKRLSPRDMIELGDGKFMFVPLCDETFSWEEYITKG